MTATQLPPSPTVRLAGGNPRSVAVRANLLPDEVISARQTDVARKQVLLGLVVVVALVLAWFAVSWWQTSSARSDLSDARGRTTAYANQENQFGPLVQTQLQAQQIQGQLATLMTGDIPWKDMLTKLRSAAPAGVQLQTVTALVGSADGTSSTGSASSVTLNETGKATVGQITVTGTAGTKKAVAAYNDQLAGVKGLTAPLITKVVGTGSAVDFTINVLVTSDALGGRYQLPGSPSAAPGGK